MTEPRKVVELPTALDGHTDVRWLPWERAPLISHVDQSCDVCAHPGPLRTAWGRVLYTPPPGRRITRRSRVAEGVRPASVPEQREPWWVDRFWAVRCAACDVVDVWVREPGRFERVWSKGPSVEVRTRPGPGQDSLF